MSTDEPSWWLVRRVDGDEQLGVVAVALLFGVHPDSIDPHQHPVDQLTEEQQIAGRERRNEAVAAGANGLVEILRYWARRELGVDVLDGGDWVILMPLLNPN